MCGIAGYLRPTATDPSPLTILRMTSALRHRGPDDQGLTLIDPTRRAALEMINSDQQELPHTLALGHTRFSILDLSPAGHQPFWSADRSVCATFNGEIYNYLELRRELESFGHRFHTNCDTEVLVESYRRWGGDCFSRFLGFWALALYDANRRALLLSRDRLGKAPLYTARHRGILYFASEIPAILAVTGRDAFGIKNQAIADFMAHSWRDVHNATFYEGITTFPNAAFAYVDPDGSYQPQIFWKLPTHRLSEKQISIPDAAAAFRDTLDDDVRLSLRADVPVGFELSGGIDSSCLVASAAFQNHKLHAYTVSFPGTPSDEEPYARLVRDRYSGLIEYTVLHPRDDDFWQQADEYVGHMAEPFHAPNVLTNRGIWRQMADLGIRVSLNGAAGDESWCGYANDYYLPFLRHLARNGHLAHLIRNARLFGDAPHSLTSATFWRRLRDAIHEPQAAASNGISSPGSRHYAIPPDLNPLRLQQSPQTGPSPDLESLLIDYMGPWRMNYWLRVANQSYMSVPTEVRCPFLDHRLVELAFRLPLTYLIRDGYLKWLPRHAMADRLPERVIWRKRKSGFPFPYEQWTTQSRDRFFSAIRNADCPYVDLQKLRRAYDPLAHSNPLFLWRIMSLALWYKKCVLGQSLTTNN
jgi:asparagine synthase (glutamine-hydrolysing)